MTDCCTALGRADGCAAFYVIGKLSEFFHNTKTLCGDHTDTKAIQAGCGWCAGGMAEKIIVLIGSNAIFGECEGKSLAKS